MFFTDVKLYLSFFFFSNYIMLYYIRKFQFRKRNETEHFNRIYEKRIIIFFLENFSNKISNIFEFILVQGYFYITISNFSFKESIFYRFVTNANKEQRVFRTMEKDYRSIFFPFKISLIKSKSYYLVITHPDIYIIERNFQFNVKKE